MNFNAYIDGLARQGIKEKELENYCKKYKYQELDTLDRENVVMPVIAEQSAIQRAASDLLGQSINAHSIQRNKVRFEKVHLYLRPVFAFEFVWSVKDKVGVIEVDGLTGEVTENGNWFKDKMERVLTREMLVDAGSEIAGTFIPGGGIAVKVVNKLTEK